MVAFSYRMPAGIPGEMQRIWSGTTIEQNVQESPFIAAYGMACILDSNTGCVRAVQAADTALSIYGFAVRPYPIQAGAASGQFGAQPLGTPIAPPQIGVIDILRRGYINVLLGGSVAAKKGGAVFIWIAASSGAHVQGQPEAAATGGSTIAVADCIFQGPADASGNVEISFNI